MESFIVRPHTKCTAFSRVAGTPWIDLYLMIRMYSYVPAMAPQSRRTLFGDDVLRGLDQTAHGEADVGGRLIKPSQPNRAYPIALRHPFASDL